MSFDENRAKLINLNNNIAVHAKRKELTNAMILFKQALSEGIANSHTYSAIINACIRCGSLPLAESIHEQMLAKGRKTDVILCTCLMKGYCENGQLKKALNLLELMLVSKPKIVPNIRTINTILRGCVQIGDIDTAEQLVDRCVKELKIPADVSTWEYLVILLCQGLRLEKALPIVGRLKAESSMITGIANMNINLARAAALLGEWKTCRKSLTAATNALYNGGTEMDIREGEISQYNKVAVGGKRAWKSGPGADEDRQQSLERFREHSKEEMIAEVAIIDRFVSRMQDTKQSSFQYLYPYFLRMFSFSMEEVAASTSSSSVVPKRQSREEGEENDDNGEKSDGESSNESNEDNEESVSIDAEESTARRLLIDSIVHDADVKFGLGIFVKKITNQTLQSLLSISSIQAISNQSLTSFEYVKVQIQRIRHNIGRRIDSEGKLRFENIFEDDNSSSSSSKPLLKMEICSGAGEWAVAQAKEDKDNRWITLELRHDRVYQTLTKSLFSGANNMCILGGDAMKILPERISNDIIDNLFVNHPEPPQQKGGLESQGKHLMTDHFFMETNRILVLNGMFTIVTDNLWYGKYLIRQLGELISTDQSITGKVNRFQLRSVTPSSDDYDGWRVEDSNEVGKVYLFAGKPGPAAGHIVDASSYFDRLWKKESLMERYFIILKKLPIGKPPVVTAVDKKQSNHYHKRSKDSHNSSNKHNNQHTNHYKKTKRI